MPGLTYTIADLIRQSGKTQADALREQARLRADQQRASGLGLGQAIADVGQAIRTIPAQQQQAQRQAAIAERDRLEAEKLRGEIADKASERQRAAAFQAVLAKHPTIDDAVNDPALMQADPEKFSELMQKHVLPARKAAEDERARKNTFIAQQLGSAEDQGTWTKARYIVGQVYPDAVADVPEDFEQAKPIVRSKLLALVPPKERLEQMNPKPVEVNPGNTLVNPQTGATVFSAPPVEKPTKGATVGSFEDFILRKYGESPTPEQVLEGRKLYGQADDRPRVSVSVSGGNEDAKAIAQAIANGDQPPTLTGLYRNAAPVRAELARMKYDLTKATTDWNATQKHVATLNGAQQTRMAQAIDNASHSLDVIDDLANQWDGGNFPVLNKAQLALAKQGALGPKAQQIATKLDAQIADVTSELANVYMGGNSPTDHALDLAAKNLQANWSRDQLRSLIRQSKNNLQIRSNSMKNVGVAGASQGNIYAPQQTPAVNPTMRYNPATGKLEPIK